MRGDVGGLGAYFDDAGVNLMHDEWFDPMSAATRALLRLARREAPDLLLNLHSCAGPPHPQQTDYVPMEIKQRVRELADRCYKKMDDAAIPRHGPPAVQPDQWRQSAPPPLNLTSALYHAGTELPITFESTHGVESPQTPEGVSYDALLQTHHLLFQAAAGELATG